VNAPIEIDQYLDRTSLLSLNQVFAHSCVAQEGPPAGATKEKIYANCISWLGHYGEADGFQFGKGRS
jgi:hypothetical protein